MEEGVLKYGEHDGEQYGTRRVHRGRESSSRVTNKTRKAEKNWVSTAMAPASASFASGGEFAGAATSASSLSASPSLADVADDAWNADTGATSHMTPHRHFFASYEPFVTPIRLADGKVIYSAGVGSVIFEPEGEGVDKRPIELSRVLHVPQLAANLLSVLYLSLHKRFVVVIHGDLVEFAQDGVVLFTARVNSGCAAFLEGRTRVSPDSFASMASALRATVPQDLSL